MSGIIASAEARPAREGDDMSNINQTVQRVLDLDAQATKGPWETDGVYDLYVYRQPRGNGETIADRSVEHDDEAPAGSLVRARGTGAGLTETQQGANMRLVAEYRTAAPDLARALLECQAQLAAANARADRYAETIAEHTVPLDQFADMEQERDALRADLARVTEEESRAWAALTGQPWTQTRPEGSLLAAAERVVADLAAARAERDEARAQIAAMWCGLEETERWPENLPGVIVGKILRSDGTVRDYAIEPRMLKGLAESFSLYLKGLLPCGEKIIKDWYDSRGLRAQVDLLTQERGAARQERDAAREMVEAFQSASGLCVPAEERGGDPGGVRPHHVERYIAAVETERDGLRDLLREARDRLLDDAALLHRTGMTSESTKHARAADKARQMAARIAAAIGSGS